MFRQENLNFLHFGLESHDSSETKEPAEWFSYYYN